MCERIIWLIDEDEQQLKSYERELNSCLQGKAIVKALAPYPHRNDYIEPVLNNPNTVSIILDQRLKDTGITDYQGIGLAQFLRSINTKLPIYILTNFSGDKDEFSEGEWSVENIIPKSDFADDSMKQAWAARILRHIDVYQDILMEREQKYHELLIKSMNETLSDEELNELNEIESFRISTVLASEIDKLNELESIVKKHKELIDDFHRDMGELGKDD
ncbi:MAG: hypothetical protein JW804_04500 [Sedimentisphaerales bacterium]|nr:hypothetical protein [Sedimentisphaerales bacterium]